MITSSAAAGPPTGLVTFLFTDVEGSTRLWQRYRDAMGPALARHDELIEGVVAHHGGALVRPRGEGDSRFAVFVRASDAVAAACAIQLALAQEPWAIPEPVRVRVAVHTGETDFRSGDYYGPAVNHCARLRAAAHGGQVLISAVTAELVREGLAAELTVRDLGEHHLKDLERPEHIWQLVHSDLPADFPLLASVRGSRNNLPLPLTSLVGRERDVMAIRELLANRRLLTLIGSGGIGKTRLAVSVAHEWLLDGQQQVGGSVAFVDLASLLDPDLMPQRVATQLGVPEQPGRAVVATLIDALHDSTGLLVMDNCEHLVEACARLVQELLTACPGLCILATSREQLGIAGEVLWRVPSLGLPEAMLDPQQVASSEAARLFVERARAVLPTFDVDEHNVQAVAEVCRRLDGIPLALELAAARVSLLSVPEIASRLDNALGLLVAGRRLAPARQQTVRATLDWSYALLTEPERDLFERLSVFAGGFTLEAVEAIAPTEEPNGLSTLALLGRLVDTSIVVAEPAPTGRVRYRLLETLKQYGAERLRQRALVDAVRREHATYFLALAEQVEPDLSSPRVKCAQTRLEAEHDNLRAALGWLVEQADVDSAQRLAGALARFWFFRGYLAEADTWLSRALALPGSNLPTAGRAKCVQGLTMLGIGRGDYSTVERLAHESSALWHALGNQAQEAFSLFHLGMASIRLGKYDEARANLEAGLEVSRVAGDGAAEANCLFTLADLALDLGNNDEARIWAEAALVRATAIGRARQTAAARGFLGVLGTRQGDYQTAATLLEASLATWRELGELYWIAEALARLGELAIEQTDIATARIRLAESLRLAQLQADRHRIAAALEGFVQVAVLEEESRLALQLAAAAEAVRTAIGVPLPPAERARLARYLVQARNSAGNQAAEAAWRQGRGLRIEEAIDLALADAKRHTVPPETSEAGTC